MLVQLRAQAASGPYATFPKRLHTRLPGTRPTKLQPSAPGRIRPSIKSQNSPAPAKHHRFSPLYFFSLLRLSITQSTAKIYHQTRTQYTRLPYPLRYTVSFISLLGIIFALVYPPLTVFRDHFYDIVRVTGPSMSPYLNTDFENGAGAATDLHDITKSTDRVLLSLYRPRSDLHRGMVIAFRTPHDPEKWAIKRIVAVEGDRVSPLAHYPNIDALEGRGLIVPFGHVWVEGDVSDSNKKEASMDSNTYGPISTGLVMGKATHVITSFFSRWIPIDASDFKLPARIQVDAVNVQHPDKEHQSREFDEMFHNGKAAEVLKILKGKLQDQDAIEKCIQNPDMVQTLTAIGDGAIRQLKGKSGDGPGSELAKSLLTTVLEILGKKEPEPRPGVGLLDWRSGKVEQPDQQRR